MNFQKLIVIVLLSLNTAAASAGQSEISTKLGRMADNLVSAYRKTPGATEIPKAAVITFNTSKELEKRRIGFAVSEILSHNLAEKGSFVLLERTELNRVFDELKLNMSGVTSQDEALKAGKLASAEILVMGSVEEFNGTYHVNARLVKTVTGEVLATAYEELLAADFEKEAKDYVVVPKTQTIGIYFLYNYRRHTDLSRTAAPIWGSGYSATTDSAHNSVWLPGFGLRYTPFKHAMLDVSLSGAKSQKKGHVHYYKASDSSQYTNSYTSKFSVLRILAGMTGEPGRAISYFIGAGAASIKISGFGSTNYVTPAVLARVEYHPQQRIGISVSSGYDLTTNPAKFNNWITEELKTTELQRFYVEPSISIYF